MTSRHCSVAEQDAGLGKLPHAYISRNTGCHSGVNIGCNKLCQRERVGEEPVAERPQSRGPPGSASTGLGAPIAPHHGDPLSVISWKESRTMVDTAVSPELLKEVRARSVQDHIDELPMWADGTHLPSAPMTGMQWLIWGLAAAGKFFEGFVVFMTGVALPLISSEFNIGAAEHGIIGAASLFEPTATAIRADSAMS